MKIVRMPVPEWFLSETLILSWGDGLGRDNLIDDALRKPSADGKPWDEVWYWYFEGQYEGAGKLIAREGSRYLLFDLNHCSCFSPSDCLNGYKTPDIYVSLEDLKSRQSAEALREVESLLGVFDEDHR